MKRRPIVGIQLKRIREHEGYTVVEVARLSGLSEAFLRKVEAGERDITTEKARMLANGLGVSLCELLTLFVDDQNV